MQKFVMVAMLDRLAEVYRPPFFVPTAAVGVRSFVDEVNRAAEDNQLYKHADDFDLFELGTWEDETGKFFVHETPRVLILGKNAKTSS